MIKVEFDAGVNEIDEFLKRLDLYLLGLGIKEERSSEIVLVAFELLSNVLEHSILKAKKLDIYNPALLSLLRDLKRAENIESKKRKITVSINNKDRKLYMKISSYCGVKNIARNKSQNGKSLGGRGLKIVDIFSKSISYKIKDGLLLSESVFDME